jgi:hypothetical protein
VQRRCRHATLPYSTPNPIWLHAPQLRGENVIATALAFSAELTAQARPAGRLRPHDAEGSVYVDIFSSVMVRGRCLLPWRQGSAAFLCLFSA